MKLHIVMHESFEAPGAVAKWANERCYQIEYTKLYLGESFPDETSGFDILIILGGPQSPDTTVDESPHFDIVKEINFINKSICNDKKVLGICLGAQLIGVALGAKHSSSLHKEVGVFPIVFSDESVSDPLFSQSSKTINVGHWHGDMPGLTDEAIVLAKSDGCSRQIIKYLPLVYGFQCHFEFTDESIDLMMKNCSHDLDNHCNLPYIQSRKEFMNSNHCVYNEFLYSVLDKFVEL